MIWKMLHIVDPLGELMLEYDKSSEESCGEGAGLTLLNPNFPQIICSQSPLFHEQFWTWFTSYTLENAVLQCSVGGNQEMFDPPVEAY